VIHLLDRAYSARPLAEQLAASAPNDETVAVFRVRRDVEYGLSFYRNREVVNYDESGVPDEQHLLVARVTGKQAAGLHTRPRWRSIWKAGTTSSSSVGRSRAWWSTWWAAGSRYKANFRLHLSATHRTVTGRKGCSAGAPRNLFTGVTAARKRRIMASTASIEILDLRHFAAPVLRPVLEAEGNSGSSACTGITASSTRLLMQYLDSHMLPGYAAWNRARSPAMSSASTRRPRRSSATSSRSVLGPARLSR
jgi:hypothetical protein